MNKVFLQTFLLIWILQILDHVDAGRILAVFPHTGKSHFYMFRPYVYKLAERGHHVTIITHFPDDEPPTNINFVDIRNPNNQIYFNSLNVTDQSSDVGIWKTFRTLSFLMQIANTTCAYGLSHKNVQKLLSDRKHFDLVIVEFFNTDCFASLAKVYKAPLIGIFPSVMMPWHTNRFGNPDNPAYIPNHFLPYGSEMGFMSRFLNFLTTLSTKLLYTICSEWPANHLVSHYVSDQLPGVKEIVNNASLFLINSHFSIFQSRPFTPPTIEVGGLHVSKPNIENIPSNVRDFIDNSAHGFIYFSLGSTLNGSTMTKERLDTFIKVLSGTKQTILWKWEADQLPVKDTNHFLFQKWFPQNDVLGHPKCKLFINHAGLMGSQEAIASGVPLLMFPFFGDQPNNAAFFAEKGIGMVGDFKTITEQELNQKVSDLISDQTYINNAKMLQQIFLDRPQSIMETAIYWTEYVLKYNGATHLRSKSIDLYWFQEYFVDWLVVILIAIYVLVSLFSLIISKVCQSTKKFKKNTGKQNNNFNFSKQGNQKQNNQVKKPSKNLNTKKIK